MCGAAAGEPSLSGAVGGSCPAGRLGSWPATPDILGCSPDPVTTVQAPVGLTLTLIRSDIDSDRHWRRPALQSVKGEFF